MHHINIEVAPKYLYFVATSFNYNSNNNNIGCNDVTKFDYTRWTKKIPPPYDFCWYYSNAWEFLYEILRDC